MSNEDRAEHVLMPFPPLLHCVPEQSHAAAVDAVACPDCTGQVQMDKHNPSDWRVLHDETCPRWAGLLRQQRVQQEADKRDAARQAKIAARRKRRHHN
ncbi:hypothetical protein [Haloechinothrix salitolerans]|uniref:Uncharacterized protein n=1 Tax=Haloechinothrix salitolerans TaxID=926830 RepID=A0ABW2C696_9PSEU